MRSRCKRDFWEMFNKLPLDVQREARNAYRDFRADPSTPGLNFEPVTPKKIVWSVRINAQYRALGARRQDTSDLIVWFWIGTHNAYDNLIYQLSRKGNESKL